MIRLNRFLIVFFLLASSFKIFAQDIPTVFLIGEHEKAYEKMIGNYSDLLLTVCDNSMDKAYDQWIDMIMSMEEYADTIKYDIKGIKVWMNVFWNKEGFIDHIIYYPKPNSKNVDFDAYSGFLTDFIKTYRMNKEHGNGFSHYGSASFPSFGKRAVDKG